MVEHFATPSILGVIALASAAMVSAQDSKQPAALPTDIARAAQTARRVSDFSALSAAVCDTAPWQVTFSAEGPDGIRIQHSPTMSRQQVGCVVTLVAQSKFRLANASNDQ